MARLPVPGSDDNTWGTILNDFLSVELNTDGTLKIRSDGTLKSTLSSLTDVSVSSPADTQVLTYSAGSGKWTNQTSAGGPPSGAAGGDLTGTYPNPTLSATANVESIIRANRLDQFAAPTASVSFNSQKITGLANGTASTDAAAFGQIPTSLPPSGAAGGDLSGTYPNPTVAKVNGVSVSGTPSNGQVLTATSSTAASWQPASGGGGTAYAGAWSGATSYTTGEIVSYDGASFGALQASTNQAPLTSTPLWTGTPGTVDSGDAATYEIGVKFTVSQDIRLNSIAFYKASTNTGTHVARIWRYGTDGVAYMVNTATFSGESASGLQTVSISADLESGYTYVASVFMPSGHYSVTSGGYTSPVTVGSVTVPASGGLFGTTPGHVPNNTSTNNYWVVPIWYEPDTTNWTMLGRPQLLPAFPSQEEAASAYVATQTGQPGGLASLDSNGHLNTGQAGYSGSASLTFGAITNGTTSEQTITVTGAAVGDVVVLGPPAALESGLVATGYVSATSTVTVRLANVTASPITPAAATWKAMVLK